MTASTYTPEDIITKTFQAGLLITMPATLYALGGPVVLWKEGGVIVKIILTSTLLPSLVCTPGAIESTIRTACLSLSSIGNSSSTENQELIRKEIQRATGMIRATLFPVSGWAVTVQLPVQDYYVYRIPRFVLQKTGSAITESAKLVNNVLNAVHFWDGVRFTLNHSVVPVFNHVVLPCIEKVVDAAAKVLNILTSSLGRR